MNNIFKTSYTWLKLHGYHKNSIDVDLAMVIMHYELLIRYLMSSGHKKLHYITNTKGTW